MRHRVGVVIPVFNAWEFTEQCLISIARTCLGEDVQVVVVDNGSSDATPEACPAQGRTLFGDRFHYERFDVNRNFGPACNAGARLAQCEKLFFLNNDVVLEDGWLEPLLRAFEDQPGLGAVGPLLLYPETRRVQHLGVCFSPIQQVEHLFQYFPENHPVVNQPRTLQAINAAALMIPRALFREIGGFEPGYVNGFEDLELSVQIRRRGRSLMCVPESKMVHYESQSPGRFDADSFNAERFAERCGSEIVSDMNDLLVSAGYRLDVTPWFDAHAALSDERENELAMVARAGLSAQKVWDLLEMEPLWGQGYDLLAGAFESVGEWASASEVRFLQQRLCPSMETLGALGRCAARAGQAEIMEQCACLLTQYSDLLKNPEARARKFREMEYFLDKQPDEAVCEFREVVAARGYEDAPRGASGATH